MIFIIDDDKIFADCIKKVCGEKSVKIFSNAIDAMSEIDIEIPELIFLDILLDGPDGFTFLNELASYQDTAKIPIVIVSSLKLEANLESYGVVGVLNKDKMYPKEVKYYVEKYTS